MENKKIVTLLVICCMGLLSSVVTGKTNPVITSPENLASMDARWEWAQQQLLSLKGVSDFYIGYSILRPMGEFSTIGCHSGLDYEKTSLYELVYGKPFPGKNPSVWQKSVTELARFVLDEKKEKQKPEKKVQKEVAFLFKFSTDKQYPMNLLKVKVSSIELPVDLTNSTLLWLGKAGNPESLTLLNKLFKKIDTVSSPDKAKEGIAMAVGLHEPCSQAIGILKGIIVGNQPERIREKAVFWIGEQELPETVTILADRVNNDSSLNVREEAVFSLYRIQLKEAEQLIIDLAKNGKERAIRKKAIFWLGQKAVKKSAEVLTGVVYDDKDLGIQEAAVFALSQLPGSEGVPKLITIAQNHNSIKVRKKAIFWLSQSDDPKALNTIIDIINK